MANAPIYAPDPFEGIQKTLLQVAAMRQQQEAMKEDLKLRQQKLKIDQEENAAAAQQRQMDNAQRQGPQIAAQQMLAQMANQSAQPMMPQGVPVANGVANPLPQAVTDFQQVQRTATPDQALAAAPGFANEAKRQFEQRRVRAALEKSATADELKKYDMGNLVYQQALAATGDETYAREMSESYVPPTAKEAAETIEINLRVRQAESKEAGGRIAQEHLRTKYGVDMPWDQAAETLKQFEVNSRLYKQNRELTAMREQGANSRAIYDRQTKIMDSLRSEFQKNPTINAARVAATGYAKIKELGLKGTKMPGHDHIALMDAFVRLATGTVVREQQVKLIKGARSVPESLQVLWLNSLKPGGAVLSETQVQNIISAADHMIEPYKRTVADVTDMYSKQAQLNGVDPALFLTDPFDAVPPQFKETPAERRKRLQGGGE